MIEVDDDDDALQLKASKKQRSMQYVCVHHLL